MSDRTKHLVIPCYNEAQRLPGNRILEFLDRFPQWSLIFVDDGSRDGTIELLTELHGRRPTQITVLALPHNSGKAEAVRTGMRFGLERLGSRRIGFADADLAAPLEEVVPLDLAMDRHPHITCALGIRLPLLGHAVRRKWHRLIIGRVFAFLAGQVLGLPCRDTQCGMKLFQVNEALHTALRASFESRWVFDVELIRRLLLWHKAAGSTTGQLWEQPLSAWEEVGGSKLRAKDFLTAGLDLLRIAGQREIPPGPETQPQVIVMAEASQPQRELLRAA